MSESLLELLGHLEARRSVPAGQLEPPGPSPEELRQLLTIACRVPDHGKLEPWRFIVLEAGNRADLIDRLNGARQAAEPDVSPERLEMTRKTWLAAPVIVVVVSCVQSEAKIPQWEQQLAAGSVCLNLLHGACALGYRGQWLTGWAAYDPAAKDILGVGALENIAGFLHIGSTGQVPAERSRPDVADLTTHWVAPT